MGQDSWDETRESLSHELQVVGEFHRKWWLVRGLGLHEESRDGKAFLQLPPRVFGPWRRERMGRRRLQGKAILGRSRFGVGEPGRSRGWCGREVFPHARSGARGSCVGSRGSGRENRIPASVRQESRSTSLSLPPSSPAPSHVCWSDLVFLLSRVAPGVELDVNVVSLAFPLTVTLC